MLSAAVAASEIVTAKFTIALTISVVVAASNTAVSNTAKALAVSAPLTDSAIFAANATNVETTSETPAPSMTDTPKLDGATNVASDPVMLSAKAELNDALAAVVSEALADSAMFPANTAPAAPRAANGAAA